MRSFVIPLHFFPKLLWSRKIQFVPRGEYLHLPDILMSNFSYSASSLIRDAARHDSNTSLRSVLYYGEMNRGCGVLYTLARNCLI